MSSVISALVNPAPVIAGNGRFAITASTNTSPIQLTISPAPGFEDQDVIEVLGHATNTHANGVWNATKINSTTYSLNGSVGNGVGGATGYCVDYTVDPRVTVPGDGDLASASSINPAIEGIFNLNPFFYRLVGKYRLVDIYFTTVVDDAFSTSPINVAVSSSTYAAIGALSGLISFTAPAQVFGGNDFLEISFNASVNPGGTASGIGLGIGVAYAGGAYSLIGGSASVIAASNPTFVPIHLASFLPSPFGATTYSTFNLAVMFALISGAPTSFDIQGSYKLVVKHYRPN
jgi:hypothetical protein